MHTSRRPKNPVVSVHFPLDPEEHGLAGETMWCEPVGSGLYKLWNVPVTFRGVNRHDIIKANEIDGRLTFVSVAIRAGHSTYAYVTLDTNRFDEFWQPLARLGIESSKGGGVVAIDIPPRADIFDVRRAFRRGQEAGVWDCEEMTCGHLMALAHAS